MNTNFLYEGEGKGGGAGGVEKKFYTIYSANVLDHCGVNKLA